jgi:hypothetical protein
LNQNLREREREREEEEEDIDQKQLLGVILSALNEDEKINFQAGVRQKHGGLFPTMLHCTAIE